MTVQEEEEQGPLGHLALRRQAAIVKGGITDHRGEAVIIADPSFDLDKTIFAGLEGKLARSTMRRELGVLPYWSEAAAERISAEYSKLERPPSFHKPLVDFMNTECCFNVEHADGSFLDHLTFCHDYCAAHFKHHSPRVLLLHSIMGVATNCFPMAAEKIPQLAELLTPFEMRHVEIFPSVLRLLLSSWLLEELEGRLRSLDKLQGIRCHRVIDNKEIKLDAADFWIHLNYQMVHLLDFVPTTDWEENIASPVFQVCLGLYSFLERAGQLRATVHFNPVRVRGLVPAVRRRLTRWAVADWSQKIGHSLDYELMWA